LAPESTGFISIPRANPPATCFLAANPHLKFFNSQRGYSRVTVDQHQWRNDFRVVPYVDTPGAPISTRATYVVEDRHPHVHAG